MDQSVAFRKQVYKYKLHRLPNNKVSAAKGSAEN